MALPAIPTSSPFAVPEPSTSTPDDGDPNRPTLPATTAFARPTLPSSTAASPQPSTAVVALSPPVTRADGKRGDLSSSPSSDPTPGGGGGSDGGGGKKRSSKGLVAGLVVFFLLGGVAVAASWWFFCHRRRLDSAEKTNSNYVPCDPSEDATGMHPGLAPRAAAVASGAAKGSDHRAPNPIYMGGVYAANPGSGPGGPSAVEMAPNPMYQSQTLAKSRAVPGASNPVYAGGGLPRGR